MKTWRGLGIIVGVGAGIGLVMYAKAIESFFARSGWQGVVMIGITGMILILWCLYQAAKIPAEVIEFFEQSGW